MLNIYGLLDEHFRELIDPAAPLMKRWTGAEFGEGPALPARNLITTPTIYGL